MDMIGGSCDILFGCWMFKASTTSFADRLLCERMIRKKDLMVLDVIWNQ